VKIVRVARASAVSPLLLAESAKGMGRYGREEGAYSKEKAWISKNDIKVHFWYSAHVYVSILSIRIQDLESWIREGKELAPKDQLPWYGFQDGSIPSSALLLFSLEKKKK
jgi:hypothetical protein